MTWCTDGLLVEGTVTSSTLVVILWVILLILLRWLSIGMFRSPVLCSEVPLLMKLIGCTRDLCCKLCISVLLVVLVLRTSMCCRGRVCLRLRWSLP